MAKFGAIIATSILDAGGRNVTISMSTKNGTKKMSAVVGMVVFMQYWYWFPLAHFISLTFTPTCLIGLNKELKMPVVEFVSNTKPSTFAFPPKTEVKTSAAPTKVATAILSTTAKTEARKKVCARQCWRQFVFVTVLRASVARASGTEGVGMRMRT
jgi:26S proteasome regulatory subunit N2